MAAIQRLPWSEAEDEAIRSLVESLGKKSWKRVAATLATQFPGVKRNSKQCRERWFNHLDPSVRRESWTEEESMALYKYHQLHGNQWAVIAKLLPGRTDNSIKNHLYSQIRKFVRCFNKKKPAHERILRTMKSLIRDSNITKAMLKYYGHEKFDFTESEPVAEPPNLDVLQQQFMQYVELLKQLYAGTWTYPPF